MVIKQLDETSGFFPPWESRNFVLDDHFYNYCNWPIGKSFAPTNKIILG